MWSRVRKAPREARVVRALLEQLPASISGGWLLPGRQPLSDDGSVVDETALHVVLRKSRSDLPRNQRRTTVHSHRFVDAGPSGSADGVRGRILPGSPLPWEQRDLKVVSASPSGRFLATVRKVAAGAEDPAVMSKATEVLEIFDRMQLVRTIDLGGTVHGDVIGDAWFGGFAWSPDEQAVVFVAESKDPTRKLWLDPSGDAADAKGAEAGSSGSSATPGVEDLGLGSKFEYREDWGEEYTGVGRPCLFAAHLRSGRVSAIPGLTYEVTEQLSLGQPSFSRDGRFLLCTGWPAQTPRRLGMIYCYHRPCGLFAIPVDAFLATLASKTAPSAAPATPVSSSSSSSSSSDLSSAAPTSSSPPSPPPSPSIVCLTPDAMVARSGRFSRKGDRIAFVAMDPTLTHNGVMKLGVFAWADWLEAGAPTEPWGSGADSSDSALSTTTTSAPLHAAMAPASLASLPRVPGVRVPSASATTFTRIVVEAVEEYTPEPVQTTETEIVTNSASTSSSSASSAYVARHFPGLFCDNLPRNCWSANDRAVYLKTLWESRTTVIRVDMDSGAMVRVPWTANPAVGEGAWSTRLRRMDPVYAALVSEEEEAELRASDPYASWELLDVRPLPDTPATDALLVTGQSWNTLDTAGLVFVDNGGAESAESATDSSSASAPKDAVGGVRFLRGPRVWEPLRPAFADVAGTSAPEDDTVDSFSFDVVQTVSRIRWRVLPVASPPAGRPSILTSPVPAPETGSDPGVTLCDPSAGSSLDTFNATLVLPPRGLVAAPPTAPLEAASDSSSASSSSSSSSSPSSSTSSSSSLPPLVLYPHGGPHSAFSTAAFSGGLMLASLGFAALAVNYRGSIGAGGAALRSLPGRIGRQDVDDCMQSLHAALSLTPPVVDRRRLAVTGGSHGGFLGAHLVGQFPDTFRACALRNPVINLPGMASVTDIPDWCHVEVSGRPWGVEPGATHGPSPVLDKEAERHTARWLSETFLPPTVEDLRRMFERSPIALLERMKTPLLLSLGAKDRRVPPSQGLEFHHALRAKGVPTRLFWFPNDTHSLGIPVTEAENLVHIATWFRTFV